MKIAHLISQFYPHAGGAEICCHNVCRTLLDKGESAVVVTTSYEPPRGVGLPYGVECLWSRTCGLLSRFPVAGKAYLHSRLASLQRKHSFDLWQVTAGYPLGGYAVDFFRKKNIPCILRCCGEDIQKFPEINYGYRLDKEIDALVSAQYPLFDGFVALTPTVREEYLKMGIPENKIRIIPNGVNFAKFAKARGDSDALCEIRKRFDVGERKLILTTGRYHPKKGFDQIPEIARHLRDRGEKFFWVIAGKGTCEIRKKFPESDELGIACSEDFTKSGGNAFSLPPDSLVRLYCAADIYVLPTLIETFGMVLVEAMAAGLPIVTTDAPGVRDVIEQEVNGFKVKTGNTQAIADKIIELLANPSIIENITAQCLKMAKDVYDWNVVTNKYLDFYRELAIEVGNK